MSKEKLILDYAEEFLGTLSEHCISYCGSKLSAIEQPVFRKFLKLRVKRELEFYRLCLDLAVLLHESGTRMSKSDIDEIIEESKVLDKKLKRDIRFLPLRIEFDYRKIIPLRRKRAEKQVELFYRLLCSNTDGSFAEIVKEVYTKEEYLDINNEILELYADEAFIINSTIKSVIKVDSETLAHNMYCSMLDVGFKINRDFAERLFS